MIQLSTKKYAITSHSDAPVIVDVVVDGKPSKLTLQEKYQVGFSEEVTERMDFLFNKRVISYGLMKESDAPKKAPAKNSTPKKD